MPFDKLCRLSLIFLIFMLLYGCDSAEMKPITIGINPWPGYEFLYLAKEKGFYQAEGLPVKLVEYNSLSEVRRGYERGKLDAMAVTLVEVLQAKSYSARHPMVILIADFSYGGDVILARRGIKKIEDLKGKKVAADTASVPIFLLARALEQARLDLDDITLLPLEQTSMEREYINGKIDAIVTYPPISIRLQNRKDTHLLFSSKQIPGEIIDVLAMDETVLNARPEAAGKILRAWERALQYAKKNPADAYAIMAKREGIKTEEFADALQGLKLVSLKEQTENFKHLASTLSKLRSVLIKTGTLPHDASEYCCIPGRVPGG